MDEALIALSAKYPNGLTDKDIKEHFPNMSLHDMASTINAMLKKGNIQILQQGKDLIYRILSPAEMNVVSNLDSEEKIVYQCIKASGSKGIWIKDIKLKTNLHQNVLTKMLKGFESKKIVKAVKSVKNSTKKVYMLFDIEPSVEITGGPWFSDNELDTEFIEGLMLACLKFIASKSFPKDPSAIFPSSYHGYASLETIHRFIMDSGICTIDLAADDIACLLDALEYDGKIERVSVERADDVVGPQLGSGDTDLDGDVAYRAVKPMQWHDVGDAAPSMSLMNIPCGVCPVIKECGDVGPISSMRCEYLARWTDLQ